MALGGKVLIHVVGHGGGQPWPDIQAVGPLVSSVGLAGARQNRPGRRPLHHVAVWLWGSRPFLVPRFHLGENGLINSLPSLPSEAFGGSSKIIHEVAFCLL